MQLEQSSVKQQLQALQRQLELLEVGRKEDAARFEVAEKKNRELEERGGRGIARFTLKVLHKERKKIRRPCVTSQMANHFFVSSSYDF